MYISAQMFGSTVSISDGNLCLAGNVYLVFASIGINGKLFERLNKIWFANILISLELIRYVANLN